jgi:uncharacterized protein YgiM (DUF1202 family)
LFIILLLFFCGVGFARAQDAPTATPGYSYVLVEDIFVRGGPGENYPAVGSLRAGDPLLPVARSAQGDWVMIAYSGGFGWIRRDLARWLENINALPMMESDSLTPAGASASGSEAGQFATATPVGNWVRPALGAFVRAGPGRQYERLGAVTGGQLLEALSRDESAVWVMIRFKEGYGWVSRDLVSWSVDIQALPVMLESNLTPTVGTPRASTSTPTATPSFTPTLTPTTAPSVTPTATNTPSRTLSATSTATLTSTATVTPSRTPTATNTPTLTVTATAAATSTVTEIVETAAQAALAASPTNRPSATPVPASETPQPTTPAPSATVTTVETEEVALVVTPMPATPMLSSETPAIGGGVTRIPVEAIAGGIGILVIVTYVGLYWRGQAASDRYPNGFVVQTCPVCRRGELTLDTRPGRRFGIPSVRRTVRCSECRSVLRETGAHRWRYAVDPMENALLYERYNGREIDDETLASLVNQAPVSPAAPPRPRNPSKPPAFVDDEESG